MNPLTLRLRFLLVQLLVRLRRPLAPDERTHLRTSVQMVTAMLACAD